MNVRIYNRYVREREREKRKKYWNQQDSNAWCGRAGKTGFNQLNNLQWSVDTISKMTRVPSAIGRVHGYSRRNSRFGFRSNRIMLWRNASGENLHPRAIRFRQPTLR